MPRHTPPSAIRMRVASSDAGGARARAARSPLASGSRASFEEAALAGPAFARACPMARC